MSKFLIILTLFCSTSVWAQVGVSEYSCRLALFNGEIVKEWNFDVKSATGSHGGQEMTFQVDDHEVVVLANGTWLGVSWFRGDVKIAEAVNVQTSAEASSRVLITYDPMDHNNEVHLNCDFNKQ